MSDPTLFPAIFPETGMIPRITGRLRILWYSMSSRHIWMDSWNPLLIHMIINKTSGSETSLLKSTSKCFWVVKRVVQQLELLNAGCAWYSGDGIQTCSSSSGTQITFHRSICLRKAVSGCHSWGKRTISGTFTEISELCDTVDSHLTLDDCRQILTRSPCDPT